MQSRRTASLLLKTALIGAYMFLQGGDSTAQKTYNENIPDAGYSAEAEHDETGRNGFDSFMTMESQVIQASPPPTPELMTGNRRFTVSASRPNRITFYYCEQEAGYPEGDGGNYCSNFANGDPVTLGDSGKVAACDYLWELGTELLIPGYGQVKCVDRGLLTKRQVDVFFYTNGEYSRSGLPALGDYANVSIVR